MRRALARVHINNPLYVVRDGEEAMEFLRHTGRYADAKGAPRPGLVLLDLNLPRVDGREVLEQIKGDPALRRIPVVVLTSSLAEADVMRCYDQGANSYVTKPVDFEEFLRAVAAIGRYWLHVAEIPDDEGRRR